MISGFGPSSIEPDIQLRAYMLAADGSRDDAIRSACRRFIRGEVKEHRKSRLPTAAEFAEECRSEHSRILAEENRKKTPALPKPEEEPSGFPPEHRAKMRNLFSLWKRADQGDKQAQEEMKRYGWRR